MNENIITWNFVNWVTIVLMAAVGFLVLASVSQVFHKARGSNSGASDVTMVGAGGLQ